MGGVQLGTAGEWFSGAAAAGALFYAVRIGTREDKAAARRQAELVVVLHEETWHSERTAEEDTEALVIINGSDLPITDVRVPQYRIDEGDEVLTASLRGSLGPGQHAVEPIDDAMRILGPRPYGVEFTDASGRRWHRTVKGALTELGTTGFLARLRARYDTLRRHKRRR